MSPQRAPHSSNPAGEASLHTHAHTLVTENQQGAIISGGTSVLLLWLHNSWRDDGTTSPLVRHDIPPTRRLIDKLPPPAN